MEFQDIINYGIYGLLALLVIMGVRYLYLSITQRVHHPDNWIEDTKHGKIPSKVKSIESSYEDKIRLYNYWLQVKRLREDGIEGDFAELGVYKGESAEIIHNLNPDRIFHLFDSFTGFRTTDLEYETGEAATYTKSDFADTDLEMVQERLGNSDKLKYHAGYFPETTEGLEDVKYALVSIDADLYKPVKDGLEYFYPRLSPGGVIIIHDYNFRWDGLCKAVDDFTANIPENLIHVPDKFGSVMIIKNKEVK